MSKIRNLPEITTLADDDLLYAVDESAGTNGGRKITKANLKASVEQTAAEIKTAYESNPNTNAFTDADNTKLAGIEPGATADQIASEVPYTNTISGLSATNVQDAIDETSLSAQADFRPSIVSGRVLHYSGGTARFDGVFISIPAGDILLSPSITNGEVYLDLDGTVKQTGSATLSPPYTIVFAQFSTDLNNIISLTDERVKNSQNIIRGILSDIRDVRAGAAASQGSSGRISDAMHKHNILTGTPSTQTPDQSDAEGTSANLARADHIHNLPSAAPIQINANGANTQGVAATFALSDHKHDILTGTPSTLTPDLSNSAGSSSALAKADHIHDIPADAPTINLSPSTSNLEGVGTSFARNDHTHALDMAQAGDYSTVNAGDAEILGTAPRLAKADHQHPVSTATAVSLNPTSTDTEGSSTSLARADHTHAISTALVTDITTIVPDATASAGTANTYARGDHRHAIVADVVSTQTPDQVNAEGTSSSFARADHIHDVPTASAVGLDSTSTSTQGAASTFARSNHTHAIASGIPSTQNADQSNAAGSSANFAKADHIHNIPTAIAVDVSSSNAQGSASTFSKADHVHKGLHSLKANSGTQRFGDTSLVSGAGITVTDDGSGNFTLDTIGGPNELVVTAGAGLSANFTTGKVRFDGAFTQVSAGSISLTPSQTNGRIYVDVDGVVKQTAGGVLTPPYAVAIALFSTNGSAITSLVDHRTFLDQNIIRGLVSDIVTIVPNATSLQGATNRLADAGHTHAIATAAAIGLDSTSTSTEGAASSFARSNHTHAIASGVVSSQTPDQSNAAGSSANFAKADHVHNIATATAVGLTATSTSTQGSASTFTRSDHTHAIASGTPSTQVPDQSNATGTSTNFARADHIHNIPSATPSTISTTSTDTRGSAASFALSDHLHQVTVGSSEATATVDDTTTSATDVLINSMTNTPVAGTYLVIFSGSIVNSANGAERTWVSLYLNGSQVSATERSNGTNGGAYDPCTTHAIITTPGSQAIEARWRVAGGTSTVHSRRLTLIRLS